nr:MAG TPA_asm: hypothetical protein [Caudoviricetes sp.]
MACRDGASPARRGEGACARGGAAPLSPPRILLPLPYIERYTHNREKREIEEHTTTPLPANPANPANPKTWYGEGIERVRSGSILHPSGFFLDER